MPLENDRYPYRVIWSEDDREYVGLCAEFPSLSWLDKTPESALKGIGELVEGVIKDMKRTTVSFLPCRIVRFAVDRKMRPR